MYVCICIFVYDLDTWQYNVCVCVYVSVCMCEREYQTHSSVIGRTQNKFKIYVDSRTTVSM